MHLAKTLGGYPRLLLAGNPSTVDNGMLLVGIVSAIASGVPFPLIGIIFGQLLNDFNSASCASSETPDSGSHYQHSIDRKILLILYLAIAQFVTIYIHLACWSFSGARLAQRLREQYLQRLLQQEPLFFDNLPPGEVSARLNGDIQAIRSGTSEKVGICISSLSFFVTAYIVAFIKDATLAAMLISLIPAYFLMSLVGSHYIEKYSGLVSDHAATAASIASEALSNIMVVHAFGASARLEEKFTNSLRAAEYDGLKKAAAVGIQSGVLYFVAYSANGLAFWQGSKQIADAVHRDTEGTSVGAVFTVIFILIEATLTLSQVAPFLHLFAAAVASFQKLRDDLDRVSLIDGTSTSGLQLQKADGEFEFKSVSFVYPSRPEITVLDQVNLSIPPNRYTAIVGLSGSGKSTIAGLVTRLFDPTDGQILFDGHDIRDLSVRQFRGFLSLVQQEPSLLDRSLLENIAFGLNNSSDPKHAHLKESLLAPDLAALANNVREGQDVMAAAEKMGSKFVEIVTLVQKAAALADADSFITRLQYGYGTLVGSAGRLISGGQKQRVALARALVKDPRVLILDEATAALDSESEQRIQRAIANIAGNRTIISIAHRLSTVSSADNIVVLQKGRVLEEGNHSKLMRRNGTYANLVRLQTLESTDKTEGGTPDIADIGKPGHGSPSEGDIEKTSPSDHSFEYNEKAALSIKTQAPLDASEGGGEEPATPTKSLWFLVRGFAPLLRPHLLVAVAALVGSSVVGGSFSAEAVIFGNTVGRLNPCNSEHRIRSGGNFFGLMFFVLAIIEFFANLISWSGFGWVSEKLVYTTRHLSFRSLFEQDLQWHQSEGRTPDSLLSYITRDGDALSGLSGSVIGTIFSITINLVAAIILTNIIAWKIALVCLSLVPLLLGAGLMQLRVLAQFEERHETAYTKSVEIGVEAITSIKTIASLSLEEETMQAYRRSLKGPRKETFKVSLHASLWQAMNYLLGNLVNALAYWWGAKQIIAGNYSQVQFLIVVFSLLVSALLWSQMFALAPELSSARAAMARILSLIEIGRDKTQGHPFAILSNEKDLESAVETKQPSSSSSQASSVEFRDVHFSYPARPDMQVLKGLSLDIQPGKFVALVGPSGAGKSTIMALLERMYTPQAGSILIDGVDVTKGRDVSFRDSIAMVPQESVLFESSIEFNVGLGAKPGHEVTMQEIEEACKLANIHDTIQALPEGYKTLCGPNGNQFSGGQKQRLSIARALVRKPKLLILDEPTSALDAESETLLQEGIEKASKDITVIAIAHRLRTIRKADVIFLIEDGRCVDRGTHEELLKRSASYRSNVVHQTLAV